MHLLPFFLGCASPSLTCGPGTHEEGDLCLPDAPAEDTAADEDSADSGDTRDTSDAEDTEETEDTEDTGNAEEVIEVYILAGQSNMDGYALYTGLPPSWQLGRADVPLYWSGWGEFRPLAPASYGGSAYAGPEVAFGQTLADAGRHIALVKHAVGGTDLYSYWYPGDDADETGTGTGWSTLMDTMQAAAAELDAQGEPWRWAGFLWMQGESDALSEDTAALYEDNLTRLIRRVREETDSADLPAVLGLIACEDLCPALDTVRAAQQAVADADPDVTTIETLDLPRNAYDPWHYDGPAGRVLGVRFAEAVLGTEPSEAPTAALAVSSYATNYDGDFTVGWVFTTSEPILLTDIGGFAQDGYVLFTSSELGIWDTETTSLVLREALPSWYEAPSSYRDGFWYVAIDPMLLEPGSYAIGLVSWTGDTDRYADSATVSTGEEIEITAAAYHSGQWLAYPETQIALDGVVSFLGPSFLYLPAGG